MESSRGASLGLPEQTQGALWGRCDSTSTLRHSLGGPHFWREDGLGVSGARVPSLQKRGPQGLFSHFIGGNPESERRGRKLCFGPTPHHLCFLCPSSSPHSRQSQLQQPQSLASTPAPPRTVFTWPGTGPPGIHWALHRAEPSA